MFLPCSREGQLRLQQPRAPLQSFMSISPTDGQRSATSPPRESLGTNPSPSHGDRHHPGRPIAGGGEAAVETAPVPVLSADEHAGSSGPTHGLNRVTPYSNNNVIGSRVLDARKGSYGRKRGTLSQCQSTSRGGISSQIRSDQIGHGQISGRSSETANFLHSDHLVSSSSSLQVHAAQSVSRRHQVVNANHLLNFHYDPISRPQPRTPPRRQQKIRPYNKDLFLQANYKFVVLDTGKYQLESMDPDKMLQWDDVICVRYSTPFPVQCPICLESPLCPQITSCGHIYCFPCILQYLSIGEDERKGECWKKCPLCFLMISPKDLYTIHIDKVKHLHVGDRACFTLLTRSKDSLVPSLKNKQAGLDLESSSSDGIWDSFTKFILTSDVDLSVRAAKSDLNDWLSRAELGLVDDMERLPYVCTALEQLEGRLKNWKNHKNQVFSGSPPIKSSLSLSYGPKSAHDPNKMQGTVLNLIADAVSSYSDPWESEDEAFHEKMTPDSSPLSLSAVPESDESVEKAILPPHKDKGLHRSTNNCNDARERNSYTFYQAIDGQHLILHPFNMRCLLDHYGSYDLLPQRISGDILELETVTQSEAMRRRYRFLSHFSLTTSFQLCEIDLSAIVPPSSLDQHMNEIKKREKQRKRVAKLEEDARALAEATELPDWTIPPDSIQMLQKDAKFSLDDFTALGSGVAPSTSPPITNGRKLFSNVTRLGFAAAHDSPSLTVEESADPSENSERTGQASSIQGSRAVSTLSFADVISTAKTVERGEMQKANGLGKKGKKSNKLLLSTSGGRRY